MSGSGDNIPIHSMPGFRVRRFHQLHDTIWEKELNGRITAPQFGVLSTLAARPGIHQRVLCSLVALDSSTTADIVNRLVRSGLIHKRRDPGDRRRSLLELTSDGEALVKAAIPAVHEVNRRLTSALSEEDAIVLAGLIDRVLAAGPRG
ncbi:hypothetical protein GCM10017673_04710 [Streptosporangium violaceochromogenes]|nr:hypothetical protein GCM10017673_04710 [Streptosporangium violaceochromogenes]